MPTLLRIDASARLAGSNSRVLGDHAQALWQAAHPAGSVIARDVSGPDMAPIAQDTITGFYTAADAMTDDLRRATAVSDTLIAELQSADCLLLTTPIYNFGVPAGLKAWIDQITRIGHTFAYEDGAFRGLVRTPRAIVALAYGADGYAAGGPLEQTDFLRPYLAFLLGFLGIGHVDFITAEATTADEATVAQRMQAAKAALHDLLPANAA